MLFSKTFFIRLKNRVIKPREKEINNGKKHKGKNKYKEKVNGLLPRKTKEILKK